MYDPRRSRAGATRTPGADLQPRPWRADGVLRRHVRKGVLCAQAAVLAAALTAIAGAQEKALVVFAALTVDANSQPTTYTSSEVKIVPKGGSASSTALIKLSPVPVPGSNELDISVQLATLPAADYDVWVRLRNAKGWGAYGGPIRFTVPLAGPQAAAPAIATTTPLKPQMLTASVVLPPPPPPPDPPPPATIVTTGLFADTDVPAVLEASDLAAYELGVRFRSAVPGRAHGVRFFKGLRNTGVHVGHLWDSAGVLLATCQFSEETATGWQYARFAEPVGITADTTYTVSYWCPQGRFSLTLNSFNAERRNGNLVAPVATATAPNGVFRAGVGNTVPNQGFQASNYWVDVLFESSVSNTLPPGPPPVTLTWEPPVANADGSPLTDLAGYCLVRDGSCEPMGLVTTWNLTLLPGTYRFAVVASDTRGNESPRSNEVEVEVVIQ